MGEELVVFRDDAGRIGVVGLRCSHRGCDLSYGRVEDGGLRCVFHGWLYDVAGHCLEQPGEPEDSKLYLEVRHPAYPACERGDVIFAYLDPGEPPLLPAFEFFRVPPAHRSSLKLLQERNYLQGVEGNIDPVHQSFLHRFLGDAADTSIFAPVTSVGGTTSTNLALYRKAPQPRIEIEETAFGARFLICRAIDDGRTFLRIYNFVMPNFCVVPGPAGVAASTAWAVIVVTPQTTGVATTMTVACTVVCSGSLNAMPGIANVQLTLEDASYRALSQGTTPMLIIAGQTNNVRLTLDGVVNSATSAEYDE